MDTELIESIVQTLLPGVPVTLLLVSSALVIGLVLGLLTALARSSRFGVIRRAAYVYVYVIRGTPLILQIFFVYYGVGSLQWVRESFLWPVFESQYVCAVLALGICTGAYTSEIIRGGILAVPHGQIEAAMAFAMTRIGRFRRIIAPLALRQMLPA